MDYLQTKTNWRQHECIFYDLPRTVINRVRLRISEWDQGDRVKHISEKIDQDGSWNSLMLDEMARGYSMMTMLYKAIEKGISKESFINIYCKEQATPFKNEEWYFDTITSWRQYECLFYELPLVLVNRVALRISEWDEGNRVKHTSEKVDQDGSWNSLMLDELAKCYASMGSKYEAIEGGITEEDFILIYCKKTK